MVVPEGARVTFLAPAFPRLPGGGARVFYEHAGALSRAGCAVTVVHDLGHATGPRRVLDAAKARIRDAQAGAFPRRRVRWMDLDDRIEMLFVSRLDDATVLPPADLRIATFWRTTRFLTQWRGDDAPFMQLLQAYEAWAAPAEAVDALWRLPIHSAVVSTSLRRRALDLGVPEDRVHLVPNGIDTATYAVRTPVAARPPCVAVLAHPAPVKGQAEAIEVLRRVHAERPHVPLVAFGSHSRPASLPDFVEYRRGLSGDDLVRQVYDRASVFLCASRSEGWGFPSMEAMACGAALVSTLNGGVDDFAEQDRTALLRPVGDVDGLAADVVRLLDDDETRARIARAGAEGTRRFTWKASGDAFVAAVEAAMVAPRVAS
jgi:glycosyltransferase involved in cell wall biosynthesis